MNRDTSKVLCGRAAHWAVGLALLLAALPLAGQAAGSSGRYLVIVDTSRSMRHRSKAMLRTVEELLNSGMQGELSGGETLGLWTFDQELYTGRFPLQVWTPQERQAIASRTLEFLKAQACQKQPSLDKVIPALEEVVKGSELLTVILISAGDAKMHGTPFDDPINDYYAQWYREQEKGQVPLVTVLRARNGQFIGWSVMPAAGPVEFPPFPPPEPAVAPAGPALARAQPPALESPPPPAPLPPPAPPLPQPKMAPPLILSGKTLAQNRTPEIPNPHPLPDSARQPEDPVAPLAPAEAGHQASLPKPLEPGPPLALKPLDSRVAAPAAPAGAPATSGSPAPMARPAPASPAGRAGLLLGSVLAGGCGVALGLLRRRGARAAPRLSLITCSLDSRRATKGR